MLKSPIQKFCQGQNAFTEIKPKEILNSNISLSEIVTFTLWFRIALCSLVASEKSHAYLQWYSWYNAEQENNILLQLWEKLQLILVKVSAYGQQMYYPSCILWFLSSHSETGYYNILQFCKLHSRRVKVAYIHFYYQP